jgi:iron complex outermembrane receptor protein
MAAGVTVAALFAPLAFAAESESPALAGLSLDELSRIQVVSVSRHSEPVWTSASATAVVTADDIRRSGVTLLPDALRLATGTEVGEINSRSFAVTIRGFNGSAANKLLPLIDGRSLYSMRFSGTIWDQRNILLDEIEQVEVVRGPGGAAWGANAVNGVINIITRDAEQTLGTRVSAGAGYLDRAQFSVRHGFQAGEHTWVRIFGGGFLRGESAPVTMPEAKDAWGQARGGFRMDSRPSDGVHITLAGETYGGEGDQLVGATRTDRARFRGGDFRARLRRELAEDRVMTVQAYYDGFRRDSGTLVSGTDMFDWDAQFETPVGDRNRLTLGANFRLNSLSDRDSTTGAALATYTMGRRELIQAGTFLQDEIALVPEQLRLNLGTKLEYDGFTGWNPLPSARLAWTPSSRATLWTAVSRAVRIPSRAENDLITTVPGLFVSEPNGDLRPEIMVAYEAGTRVRTSERTSVDVAGFYQDYDGLIGSATVSAGPPALQRLENLGTGKVYGVEVSGEWQVLSRWRLRAGGTAQHLEVRTLDGHTADPALLRVPGLSPSHQAWIRSSLDLPHDVECDVAWRHVGALDSNGIPAYASIDARLAWRPRRNLELSITGQNLLEAEHQEFRFLATRWAVPRTVYGRVTWDF